MTVNDLYWITESHLPVQLGRQNATLYEGTVKNIPQVYMDREIIYIGQTKYATLKLIIKEKTA